MPITTGLVSIKPWGSVEWVTVRSNPIPDRYRIIYDNKDLFEIGATEQAELIEKATKAWRAMFPEGL
jgi:hypothetical protein